MKKKINAKKVLETINTQGEILKTDKEVDVSDMHVDQMKEMEVKMAQLESEKKELITKLEENEIQRKGISSEQLQTKTLLSNDEVQSFKSRIKECTEILSGKQNQLDSGNAYSVTTLPNKISDKMQVMRKAQILSKTVAEDGTYEITPSEKDKLFKRKQELEAYLKKRQAALGHQNDTTDSYEFSRTVHGLVAYHEECTKLAQELKNINRILESGEVSSSNLDYLTPKKSRNI